MTDYSRLSMPIGAAMFAQRSVRKFKPDPNGPRQEVC
jgi:hypothetical protein